MAESCPEGQFRDSLLRVCMSCQRVCEKKIPPQPRCADFCVAQRCKMVPQQFYDPLLKACLRCSVVCGRHPKECSDECQPVTSRVGAVATRGSVEPPGAVYSTVLVYSLLGLCFALLLCTLSVALLALLQKVQARRDPRKRAEDKRPDEQAKPSKHHLVQVEAKAQENGGLAARRSHPCATETCVHCFSGPGGSPHQVYQQALLRQPSPTAQPRHHDNHDCITCPSHYDNPDSTSALRIICSPTQASM